MTSVPNFKNTFKKLRGQEADGFSVTHLGTRSDWLLVVAFAAILTVALWIYAAFLYSGVAHTTFIVEPLSAETEVSENAERIQRLQEIIVEKQAARDALHGVTADTTDTVETADEQ